MNISFSVVVGSKTGKWGRLENESRKDFDIDIPDGLPVLDFSAMINAVIAAAIEEHKRLSAGETEKTE